MTWPFARKALTFSGGVLVPGLKTQTADLPIRRLPFPGTLSIPLLQHVGDAARPIVGVGEHVERGQPIAEPTSDRSVAMHAPATGRVSAIGLAPNAAGHMAPAIFLEVNIDSSQENAFERPTNIDTLSAPQLILAIQMAGLVGMGGAAFPTHRKLALRVGQRIDQAIVNGAECEPYLTSDYRIMIEEPENVMRGIEIVLRITGAKEAVIGVEDNKPLAMAALRKCVPPGRPIRVQALQTKYPQGASRMLIKALNGREIPTGGHAADVHVELSNVSTVAAIGELLPAGRGMIERVVTITGPGVDRPGNYRIPIGVSLRYALECAGLRNNAAAVLSGGPMLGTAIARLDVPITKGVLGIVVLTEKELSLKPQPVYACIRCGHCIDVCPLGLNPARLGALAENQEYETMASEFNLTTCFECGSCSFVCPSNIPLVHHFRIAKASLRRKRNLQSRSEPGTNKSQ